MNDKIYNETLTVIKLINNEIRDSNFHNIEHMLLRVSAILSRDTSIPQEKIIEITLDEVRKILLNKSETYKVMYNTEKYKQLLIFFEIYMKKLLKKYNEMMIKESKQFDRYVEMSTGKMPKKKIYEQENLEMDLNNIQNTISMLNEAIRVYLELYENRTLWALFNDGEAMSFKIKEAELAHVLGVEIKKIISNPRLVDVFKITKKEIDDYNNNKGNAAVSILLKLVEMTSGNLMHYEEDRLKKVNEDAESILKDIDTDEIVESKVINEKKTDETELMELINTITAKELIREESNMETLVGEMDPLDLLSDLRGDDDTRVMGAIDAVREVDELNEEALRKAKEHNISIAEAEEEE